jgi:hypothetical protein
MLNRIAEVIRHNVLGLIAIFIALSGTAYAALANNSVTTAKLANGAVTSPKLANGAATSAKIAGGAVGTSKLTNGSVIAGKLGSASVTNAKLANHSVTGKKVAGRTLHLMNIAGSDNSGGLGLPGGVSANSCQVTTIQASGAKVGQVPFISFGGSAVLPAGLIAEAVKIPNNNKVTLRICNVSNTDSSVIGIPSGVRVITIG